MIIGFTAARELTEANIAYIKSIIVDLEAADGFVTGGCIGGDTLIAKCIRDFHPDKSHKIIIPANRSQVDSAVYWLANPKDNIIYMPERSSYRDRNTKIVDSSDRMLAFWTGGQRSGTLMTINISKRANKIIEEDIHML